MAQDDFWTKLKKRVRDVSVMAADFTEEQALIGKLKFEILAINRKVDRAQRDIGARVYEMSVDKSGSDVMIDRTVKALIADIINLEKQIEQKKVEITHVAEQVRGKSEDHKSTSASSTANPSIAKTTSTVKKSSSSKPRSSSTAKKAPAKKAPAKKSAPSNKPGGSTETKTGVK